MELLGNNPQQRYHEPKRDKDNDSSGTLWSCHLLLITIVKNDKQSNNNDVRKINCVFIKIWKPRL